MFEFTTQTVLNHVSVGVYNKVKQGFVDAEDKIVKNPTIMITRGDKVKDTETKVPVVRIGNIRFSAKDVESYTKKIASDELLTSVTFDMNDLPKDEETDKFCPGTYRIALYLGLSMFSADSFYANDYVFKGKPLYIEFPVKANDSTAAAIAKRVATIAKKYMLLTAQDQLMTISVEDETKVTLQGVNGLQNIKKASVQQYDPNAYSIDCCSNDGDFVDVIPAFPVKWKQDIESGEVSPKEKEGGEEGEYELVNPENVSEGDKYGIIIPGVPAFCDSSWILRNLRLPTLANTNYWSATKDEMPVAGGKYNQYVIRICKDRDGIAGEVVGQRATSVTTHVFYVLQSEAENFEKVLTALQADVPAKEIQEGKKADKVFEDPYLTAGEDGDTKSYPKETEENSETESEETSGN